MDTRVLNEVHFFSEALGRRVTINVMVPRRSLRDMRENPGKALYPSLTLLHGVKGDYTDWSRFTNVERYANARGLAVVMPSGENGSYNDIPGSNNRYFTFVTRELPIFVSSIFPISPRREDTFIAGLSMGGYGAMKALLNCPDVYGAGASLSGALNIVKRAREEFDHSSFGWSDGDWFDINLVNKAAFLDGLDKIEGSPSDLFWAARTLNESSGPKPKIFACCGTEDPLYQSNLEFNELMSGLDLDYTYEEGPGVHDWLFWETWIQRVIKWLPIRSDADLVDDI